jgi:transcriptional regulator NrdR family protein
MTGGNEDRQPVGFVCRGCGCGHFEVVRTVRQHGGRVKRERRCRNCGRRMATVEMPVGPSTGEK